MRRIGRKRANGTNAPRGRVWYTFGRLSPGLPPTVLSDLPVLSDLLSVFPSYKPYQPYPAPSRELQRPEGLPRGSCRTSLAALLTGLLFLCWPALLSAQDDGLDSLAVRLTDHLAGERFDSVVTHFDSTMTAQFSRDQLEELWTRIVSQTGDYRERLGLRRDTLQGYRRVFVTARFSGAVLDFLWVFDASKRVAGMFVRPGTAPVDRENGDAGASYIDPGRFEETDLTVGEPPWRLPATLTRPRGAVAVPAVVLVHGSGPNDRDESLGPNKPFRDLAHGLASRGIAVLRYDKRTLAYRDSLAGHLARLTVEEETVADAVAALAVARAAPGVDRRRVFLLGHSLGAMLAPRIAARDTAVAGVILLAAPARGLEILMVEQLSYLAGLDGDTTEAERARLEGVRQEADRVRRLTSLDSVSASLILGAPPGYWLDLRDYNPVETAGGLEAPMLILSAGRDYQVTETDDRRWREALAGDHRVAFRRYPSLNHLFIAGEGAPGPAEYEARGHVAAAVVEDIAAWIHRWRPRS